MFLILPALAFFGIGYFFDAPIIGLLVGGFLLWAHLQSGVK